MVQCRNASTSWFFVFFAMVVLPVSSCFTTSFAESVTSSAAIIAFEPDPGSTDGTKASVPSDETMQKVVGQIRARLYAAGIADARVVLADNKRVLIAYGQPKEEGIIRQLVGKPNYVTFHLVADREETKRIYDAIEAQFPNRFLSLLKAERGDFVVSQENAGPLREVLKAAEQTAGLIPENKQILLSRLTSTQPGTGKYKVYCIDKDPIITGNGMRFAEARQSEEEPHDWKIFFRLDTKDGERFSAFTESNIDHALAIVLDDEVRSAPVIRSRIGESGEITGEFGQEEALAVATSIKCGAIPLPLIEVEVSPADRALMLKP